jgi:hypothetical protein
VISTSPTSAASISSSPYSSVCCQALLEAAHFKLQALHLTPRRGLSQVQLFCLPGQDVVLTRRSLAPLLPRLLDLEELALCRVVRLGVQGSGFRVQGSGFRVRYGSEIRV